MWPSALSFLARCRPRNAWPPPVVLTMSAESARASSCSGQPGRQASGQGGGVAAVRGDGIPHRCCDAAAVARGIASAIQPESTQAHELPFSAHTAAHKLRKHSPTCALRPAAPWRADAERNGLIVPRNEAVVCISCRCHRQTTETTTRV